MDTVIEQILEKVRRISLTHPEGEKFFDALDEELNTSSSNDMYEALLKLVPDSYTIIISGRFGKIFAQKIDDGEISRRPYVLFEGGIRKGGRLEILKESGVLSSRAYFLDDSIYGGLTFRLIKNFLWEEDGIDVQKCGVIYDGCPIKKPDVEALFRYYDHFEAKPNYKF